MKKIFALYMFMTDQIYLRQRNEMNLIIQKKNQIQVRDLHLIYRYNNMHILKH